MNHGLQPARRAAQWLTFLRTARAGLDRRSDCSLTHSLTDGRRTVGRTTPLPLARNETRIGSRQTDLNLWEGKVLEVNRPILKWDPSPLPNVVLKVPV